MELAAEKRQLHDQQRDECAELQTALDQLQSIFQKDLEQVRRQVRKKTFAQEITRARRYHEERSMWEYLNNMVESIHVFTWKKTATAICTAEYQQKRSLLERELRDLDAQHRKERIILRYDVPIKSDQPDSDPPPEPHCFLP